MERIETYRWDAADYLNDEADRLAYLNAALEEKDSTLVAKALGDIARSRGMSRVVQQAAGVTNSADSNPGARRRDE